MDEKKTCCICGNEFIGFGNNPEPVRNEGECCNTCNTIYVIPARLEENIRQRQERKIEIMKKFAIFGMAVFTITTAACTCAAISNPIHWVFSLISMILAMLAYLDYRNERDK